MGPGVRALTIRTIEETIEEFKNRPKGRGHQLLTRRMLDDRIVTAVEDERRHNPGVELRVPSDATVYRIIREDINQHDWSLATKGRTLTDADFRRSGRFPKVLTHPLQWCHFDETPCPVYLYDRFSGLPLGRPYLAWIVDLFSGGIVGFYLGFAPPGDLVIAQTLTRVVDRIEENEDYRQGLPGMLVCGQPGAGKSTMVKKIQERFPRVEDGVELKLDDGTAATCDHVPVVFVVCPTKPTELSVLSAILKSLGDPLWKNRKRDDALDAVKTFLHYAGTLAIVVDEAQRPTDRKGKLTQGDIATLFQTLHDEGIVVLLFGLGRAQALMVEDLQVERRWSAPIRLAECAWGDVALSGEDAPESRTMFMGLLAAMAGAVTLEWDDGIDFQSEEVAFLFYYASRGVPGLLKKLLLGTVDVAKRERDPVITRSTLAGAFDAEFMRHKPGTALQNPFAESFRVALPPALPDDNVVLHKVPSRTKKQRQADLTESLTVS